MEHHGLAGQVRVVVLGEGDVDVLLLADAHAGDLILKAGNKLAGTDLQIKAVALAAVEGHAVQEALEVDVGNVALGNSPVLHGHHAAVAVGHLLDPALHVLISDGDLGLGGLDTLVLAQSDLGVHRHGGLEGETLLAHAQQLHLGIAHHLQLLLLDGGGIGVGQGLVHGLFVEDAGAVHVLDHLAGGFAGAEARHPDAPALLPVGLLNGSLELPGAYLHGESDHALFQFFTAFHTHFIFPPFTVAVYRVYSQPTLYCITTS